MISATFEPSPWSPGERITAPARNVRIQVTREHLEKALWRRFHDPVSIALKEHLQENACAQVFWNSDSFAPQYPGDEARVGIYVESRDPRTGRSTEQEYHLPLPQRAAQAMWRLRSQGPQAFRPFTTNLTIPVQALEAPTGETA